MTQGTFLDSHPWLHYHSRQYKEEEATKYSRKETFVSGKDLDMAFWDDKDMKK
jgi:hypothetical protein